MLICRFASAFDVNCHGVVKVLKAKTKHQLWALIPVRTKEEISDCKKKPQNYSKCMSFNVLKHVTCVSPPKKQLSCDVTADFKQAEGREEAAF